MSYESDIKLANLDDNIASRLGAINSVQRGTITVLTSIENSDTATITSVTTSRSMISYLGCYNYGVGSIPMALVELTNATTVTATAKAISVSGGNSADNGAATIVVGYQVVEFGA